MPSSKKISEPSMLVRPISRFGGLDNIHIALVILSIVLILLVVAMAYNTKISIVNVTQGSTCAYGSFNGTCISPIHNASAAKLSAEKVLAGYSTLNNSISVLPYLSYVNKANVSYVPQTGQWLVSIPYASPLTTNTYILNILLQDSNLSKFSTFVQTAGITPRVTSNYVAFPGTIKLAGLTSCGGSGTSVYWFIDPYAPGSIQSLVNATSLKTKYGSKMNLSVKALYTPYSQSVSNTYGLNNTVNLAKYVICASVQSNFTGFVKSLNASFTGTYMPAYIVQGIAAHSGFNMTSYNSCYTSSQKIINAQAVQAKYYNITSPSAVLVDCQYLALPQTASEAMCYDNSTLC